MKIKKKMQKIGALAGAAYLAGTSIAGAQPVNTKYNPIQEKSSYTLQAKESLNNFRNSTIGKTLEGLAGFVVAETGIHEGAHYLAGKATGMKGMKIYYNEVTWEQSAGDNKKAITSFAGPAASAAASRLTRNADTPFEKGLFVYSTWDGIQKAFFPNIRGRKMSDIKDLEESIGKGKTNLIRAGLGINALWNTYKYFHRDKNQKSNWEIYATSYKKDGFKLVVKKDF